MKSITILLSTVSIGITSIAHAQVIRLPAFINNRADSVQFMTDSYARTLHLSATQKQGMRQVFMCRFAMLDAVNARPDVDAHMLSAVYTTVDDMLHVLLTPIQYLEYEQSDIRIMRFKK